MHNARPATTCDLLQLATLLSRARDVAARILPASNVLQDDHPVGASHLLVAAQRIDNTLALMSSSLIANVQKSSGPSL
jgi:hypothetical protein